jgi:aquaporin Z
VKGWDALFYVVAQFLGGIAGVAVVALFAHMILAHPAINFVATVPGPYGAGIAFVAELLIAFLLMATVLVVSNTPHLARFTGLFAGCLVAVYITFEAPISGMSMNPARTFGSAYIGHLWTSLWIYFTAPVIAMQLAASLYLRSKREVYCAKFHHHNSERCIFNCRFPELAKRELEPRSTIPAKT